MAYSKQTWDNSSFVNPTRMNHIEDGISNVTDEVEKLYSNSDAYDFPTKASEVSGNNDAYTVQHKGLACVNYVFDNGYYSQFGVSVNNIGLYSGGFITSGGLNLSGVRNILTIPVNVGDVLRVHFYSSYGMASIKLKVIY